MHKRLEVEIKISEQYPFREYCNRDEVESLIKLVANKILRSNKIYNVILGITNGGVIPARLMARELNIDHIQLIPVRQKKLYKEEMPILLKGKKYLVIDEIYDTGDIYSKVHDALKIFDCDFAFLMSRYEVSFKAAYVGKILNHDKWIVFPWE
jgi:hypoxanthine phosphoribosyltransferase